MYADVCGYHAVLVSGSSDHWLSVYHRDFTHQTPSGRSYGGILSQYILVFHKQLTNIRVWHCVVLPLEGKVLGIVQYISLWQYQKCSETVVNNHLSGKTNLWPKTTLDSHKTEFYMYDNV